MPLPERVVNEWTALTDATERRASRGVGPIALSAQTGPTPAMDARNYEWVGKLLQKNPKAVQHHVVQGGGDKRLVLTADTDRPNDSW